MSDEPFTHETAVRFRDLDPMGHAHHTLPLVFFEEARARFWREVAGRDGVTDIDYIMKDVRVTYHARIRYPGRVRVELRVHDVGTTSFTLDYALRDAADATLLANGRSVQVLFDYDAGAPRPLDEETRRRLDGYRASSLT